MSEERLELVTDFGSLRAGDLVVIKPCGWCGCRHRGILLAANTVLVAWPDGSTGIVAGLPLLPLPPCCVGRKFHRITSRGVAARRIYRVVIPPAAGARETSRTKQKERVR